MNKEYVMVMVKIVLLSVIAAVILGALYIPTQAQLKVYQEEQRQLSLKIVNPDADHFEPVKSGEETLYYLAFDAGNNLIGYCFFHDQPGSQGTITLAGGVDTGYTVTGVKIMAHSETPGLGAKITEESFTGQFPGVAEDDLMLSKDGGAIDAITGATVSSVAVIDGLHAAMDEIKANE
ncbi:MAG: RnfABCDGE type electron transport complex subunit G [Euryarchaeota archaeon]|nr:RnfABCDGE type electron transport complex subunit G [Euryarchaeota archaeon]